MMDHAAPEAPGPAINLAAVADFTLGGLRVQPSSRRVCAGMGGPEELVEPRVTQALVALAEANGVVVSRDALIDRCWGGRIVGDDAINRCIAKVRRLADITDPPAFAIETVAKVGYRLKRPNLAARLPAAANRDAAPDTAPSFRHQPKRHRWQGWVAAGLLFGISAAGAAWRVRQPPRWTVQSSRALLTDLDRQTSPRMSPDGSMLAYTVDAASGHGRIYVVGVQGGGKQAVSAAEEDADQPAWAADSAQLAYVVAGRQGAPCRIMVTTVPGGTPRLAGRCEQSSDPAIAWQPGQPYLFVEDQHPVLTGQIKGFFGQIFRIDLGTGLSEQVTAPPADDADFDPRVSPDGAWLAYIRSHGFQGQVVRLRNLASNEERELRCDPDVQSLDWTADSRSVLASVPGQMNHEILGCPIGGMASYRVYATAEGLGGLATGPHGMVAVEVAEARDNLARASTTPRATPDVIDPAAGWTDWPAFAPDGTLAFVSNRSGHIAIWTRRPGGQPTELPIAGVRDIERPAWSPDGGRLAFFEVWRGTITVYVVTAQGAPIVSFTVPSVGYGLPNWTPDGQHLLMFDKRILRVVRIDLRHPDRREPVEDRLWDGTAHYGGGVYSASGTRPGIWQLDGAPRLITPDYPPGRLARLTFRGDDVLLPDPGAGREMRILAQPLNGGKNRVAFYAPGAEAGTPLAVDPQTGDVIYVCDVSAESHIDLLTLARQ